MSQEVAAPPRKLATLEAVIERGLSTFVEVGNALLEIRSRGLHRDAGFKTFEEYCQTRWNFTHQRASQLIEAAHVAGLLAGDEGLATIVANEAQARELAPLMRDDPEAAREVWGELTAEEERPTAARIRSVVQDRYPSYRPVPKPGNGTASRPTQPKVAVVTFGQILEWLPGEMAAALPEDQIEGQIAEAQAAQRWLASYVRELTARRAEKEDASQ